MNSRDPKFAEKTQHPWPEALALCAVFVASWILSYQKSEATSERCLALKDRDRRACVFEGHWCIDGHAHWTRELARFAGRGFTGSAWEDLVRFMRGDDYHPRIYQGPYWSPTTLVGPIVAAVLSVPLGGVIPGYRAASALAMVLAALVVVRLLRRLGLSAAHALTGAALFLGHYSVIHATSAFYQDGWVAFGTLFVLERSLAVLRGASVASLVLATLLGSLTKHSFAPALAIPFIVFAAGALRGTISWRRAAVSASLAAAVPILIVAGYLWVTGFHELYSHQEQILKISEPNRLVHYDLILAYQVWLPLAFFRGVWREPVRLAALLFVIAVPFAWWVLIPGLCGRLLLPIVGPMIVAASPWLGVLRTRRHRLLAIAIGFLVNGAFMVYTTRAVSIPGR